jgi:hypothetical protein
MNEADRITEALAMLSGVASVTRGWPRQAAALPCVAVGLEEESAADTRDAAAYLTRRVYGLRVFAATMGACDALKDAVIGAMAALGYTLERTAEIDGETAQLKMTFHKLD